MAIISLDSHRNSLRERIITKSIGRASSPRTTAPSVRDNHKVPLLREWIEAMVARWRRRHAIRRALLTEPDSVLADAGYTRAEAERECATPFWRD